MVSINDSDVLFSATKSFMDILLENLALPVWYKDETRRFIGCNSALASFLGRDKTEILGKTVHDIFPEDLAKILDAFDTEVLESNYSASFEVQMPHADETTHDVILFLAPFFKKDGHWGGVSGNLVDMTESRRRERQASIMARSRNQLLAVIGHDLRSPVGKLQQLLSLYQDDRTTFTPEVWEDIFGDLRKSTDSIKDLLDNLFLWSLSQQGILEPELTRFDIRELVIEVLNLFITVASSKEITLTPEIFLYNTVFSDRNMVGAILRNLVGNALKFTPRGGFITVRVYEDPQGDLAISVKDTGIGIPPEAIPDLFNPHPNVHFNGTEREKGTGFGLNLCLQLADALGGRMTVESAVGEGSKFTFTLPLDELQETELLGEP